jgi:hypothetical protein
LPGSAPCRPRFPMADPESSSRIRTSEMSSIARILGPIDSRWLCNTLLRWLRFTPTNLDQEVMPPAFSILLRRTDRTSCGLTMKGSAGSSPAGARRTRTHFNFSASQMLADGSRRPFSTLLIAGRGIPIWRAHSDWVPTRSISRRSNSRTSSTFKICIGSAVADAKRPDCSDPDTDSPARSMLVIMVGAKGQNEAVSRTLQKCIPLRDGLYEREIHCFSENDE